jgi:hypothetical protein
MAGPLEVGQDLAPSERLRGRSEDREDGGFEPRSEPRDPPRRGGGWRNVGHSAVSETEL